MHCVPTTVPDSNADSYEKLPTTEIELNQVAAVREIDEKTPLDLRGQTAKRRQTMKKLARQQSVMDTQKSSEFGSMQLTYWF